MPVVVRNKQRKVGGVPLWSRFVAVANLAAVITWAAIAGE
jgi:hypothetical protein